MTNLTDRQKKIIEASIELIAEKSIQQLTIKNLAKKIGVTEGAIYRHFKSKVDILLKILLIFQQEAGEALEKVCASGLPNLQQIENIFTHHFSYFTKKPAVTAVIFSESIFQNDSVLAKEVFKLLQMHEDALMCIIDNGQKNNEIRNDILKKELVRIIIGSIRYTVTKWRLTHFEFDLNKEGELLIRSIKEVLKK